MTTSSTPGSCPSCGTTLTMRGSGPVRCGRCGLVVHASAQQATGGSTPAGGVPQGLIEHPIGEYQIVKTLGRGGMGVVYLAYEPLLHRAVALKVLSGGGGDQPANIARFLAEAVLTGRLTHGGIIPIYQVGFDPEHGYYYSMRYVKGHTLKDVLHARGDSQEGAREYSLARLLALFQRVCEAVGFAHQNGILHRDLKPANVMLTHGNEVLVLDWGLAKDLHRHDPLDEIARAAGDSSVAEKFRLKHRKSSKEFLSHSHDAALRDASTDELTSLAEVNTDPMLEDLTQAGLLVGTPWYMSPEQIRGEKDLTPASDVYSLGVMLYRMLCGGLPVETRDITVLVEHVSSGQLRSLQSRPEASRFPKALCDIVDRCLALDVESRYADGLEIAADLELYLEGRTPLRTVVHTSYVKGDDTRIRQAVRREWNVVCGEAVPDEGGVALSGGLILRSTSRANGDFRANIGFRPRPGKWTLAVRIGEEDDTGVLQTHHEVCIGIAERPLLELFCLGRRVQRRFDVRLQGEQYYQLALELEEEHLRVYLDGSLLLNYRDVFPLNGGYLCLLAPAGTVLLRDFEWRCRGAPLHLSYHFLPDQHFRAGKFAEARRLYQQLADSHPDREEGLMARYKAGLCSAALKQTQEAFQAFSHLENTMLDHYATLGLARIGVLDGNLDWAWEALKSGYIRQSHPEVRIEMWFALLNVLEMMEDRTHESKREKYRQLLDELNPSLQEASQTTYEYLDLVGRQAGMKDLRAAGMDLLAKHRDEPHVAVEAVLALWRTGLDEHIATSIAELVEQLVRDPPGPRHAVRLMILRAELLIAQGKLDYASRTLSVAFDRSGSYRADGLWAENWMLLCAYLRGEHSRVVHDGRQTVQHMDRFSSDQLGYLLLIVALSLCALERKERAQEALTRAASCPGWWGETIKLVCGGCQPAELLREEANPNLVTGALLLAGDLYLRTNRIAQARECYRLCRDHECARVMTKHLAMLRVAQVGEDKRKQSVNTNLDISGVELS
ncbi:MAG: protein kinase [Chitinivibrionales bacterium]|nr:protein kinase [Chitinivibrionales bacterium]